MEEELKEPIEREEPKRTPFQRGDVEEDAEETNTAKSFSVLGGVIIFSFISIIFVFMGLFILSTYNNFILSDLNNLTGNMAAQGMIPVDFADVSYDTVKDFHQLMFYFDYIWLAAFISFAASSLMFSYFQKREGYFSVLSMIVMGLIILTYVGGILIQITNWFKDEILFAVFPQITEAMPIFVWYLDNVGVINLILLTLNIIINFIDLDFSRFQQRKDKEMDFSEL